MRYKTIALALIEEQPALHRRLKESRSLLSAMERHARTLKSLHEAQVTQLGTRRPGSDPVQLASEALELAVEALREIIADASPPSGSETESPPHTPPQAMPPV